MSESPKKLVKFYHRYRHGISITVHDHHSWESLKALIKTFCPDDWTEQQDDGIDLLTHSITDLPVTDAKPTIPQPPAYRPKLAAQPQERRKDRRFMAEFRVVVAVGEKIFRTTSTDISLGGMRVKHPIPDVLLNQVCRVYVGSPDLKENIQFHCVITANPKTEFRVRFKNPDPVSLQRLEAWIKTQAGEQTKAAA